MFVKVLACTGVRKGVRIGVRRDILYIEKEEEEEEEEELETINTNYALSLYIYI